MTNHQYSEEQNVFPNINLLIVIYPGKGLQETSVNITDIYGTSAKTKRNEFNIPSPHLSAASLSSISQYEYLQDYIKKYHKYTLDPNSSSRMVWYVIICLIVFYSTVMIPVQLAFDVVYVE